MRRRDASRTAANASRQDVVQGLAVGEALAELVGLGAQLGVAQGFDARASSSLIRATSGRSFLTALSLLSPNIFFSI